MKKKIRLSILLVCFGMYGTVWGASAVSLPEQAAQVQNDSALTTDESQLPITAAPDNPAVSGKQPSTIWIFIRMIFVLAVVIACIYGLFFLMKRGMRTGQASDPFLRKVSQISLGTGKSVQIVTLLDHAYIIGVTDTSVSLLGQVDDKELIDSMNLYTDKNAHTRKPRTFADVLDIFMPNGPREPGKTIFGESAQKAADGLKKQRNRLHTDQNEPGESS
jgi:flagellar protein FliO/FliZ